MRDKLLPLLSRSERSVGETMLRVEQQRAVVAALDTPGVDADLARSMLRQLEGTLAMLVAHRDQLLRVVEAA
jgi:hypothetical protein